MYHSVLQVEQPSLSARAHFSYLHALPLVFFVYEWNVLYHVFCSNCVCLMHKTTQISEVFPTICTATSHPSFVLMVVAISPESFDVCIALYSILHLLYLYSISSVYCMHINMYIHSCMYV